MRMLRSVGAWTVSGAAIAAYLDPSTGLAIGCLTGQSGPMTALPTYSTALPPLEHPLEEGWTLPAAWYSDAGVAERERELIFTRTWQYGGPAEQVAEPGSYTTTRAGHIPIVLV